MIDEAEGDVDAEPPMRRSATIALVAFVVLLPIAAVVALILFLTRTHDDDGLPPLEVGSCVFVSDVDNSITDLTCPEGNGVVIALSDSTTACPADAWWAILRDAHFYCVERRLVPVPTSG